MHLPSHLPSQQTPSMQLPLAHCLSHEQLDDWGREPAGTVEQSTLVASFPAPSLLPLSGDGPDPPFVQPAAAPKVSANAATATAATSRALAAGDGGANTGRGGCGLNCSNRS